MTNRGWTSLRSVFDSHHVVAGQLQSDLQEPVSSINKGSQRAHNPDLINTIN